MKELGNKDIFNVWLKSRLIHAYSHANQGQLGLDIPPLIVEDNTYTKLDDFDFIGTDSEGQTTYITGAKEAFTDLIGTYVGQSTGAYLPGGQDYFEGTKILGMLSNAANVPVGDLVEYYMGRKHFIDLLGLWGAKKGKPDLLTGLKIFMAVGIRVDNPAYISQEDVIKQINAIKEN